MDGGTRKGYAKLTSKNHIWNGLRTRWRRSFTLHYLHICNLPNLALIGCYKFSINFPNVVKNYIFWQNSISLIWLLLSPKYDWRKVEFNLDYFRQSGLFVEMQKSSTTTQLRNTFTIMSESCRECVLTKVQRIIPDWKDCRKVTSHVLCRKVKSYVLWFDASNETVNSTNKIMSMKTMVSFQVQLCLCPCLCCLCPLSMCLNLLLSVFVPTL